jgi:hypothetical protein
MAGFCGQDYKHLSFIQSWNFFMCWETKNFEEWPCVMESAKSVQLRWLLTYNQTPRGEQGPLRVQPPGSSLSSSITSGKCLSPLPLYIQPSWRYGSVGYLSYKKYKIAFIHFNETPLTYKTSSQSLAFTRHPTFSAPKTTSVADYTCPSTLQINYKLYET